MPKSQITIAGIGYVGLSNAVFLAQHNHATTLDIAPEKIRAIPSKTSSTIWRNSSRPAL
jgi:UDPglucose 6-dehydrogenase